MHQTTVAMDNLSIQVLPTGDIDTSALETQCTGMNILKFAHDMRQRDTYRAKMTLVSNTDLTAAEN